MSSVYENAQWLELLDSTEQRVVSDVKKHIEDTLKTAKESWLVYALVDSFTVSHSTRCLDILATIVEPHDKHLFDRLAEILKGGTHRLGSFMILSHIVRREPAWLHKLVGHPLLSLVIKCLKTDHDIPTLLIGCLAITSLLPVVPVSIAPLLPDIFESFVRLATFTLNKTGNVPKTYSLHLLVGVHCMFHRLYGMYPCNFLTYLRNIFSRPEYAEVFSVVVEPMLDQVRMHPLLVTTTKEKEVGKDRWKEKEVHDILVDCARLSLDSADGHTNLSSCTFSDTAAARQKSITSSSVSFNPSVVDLSSCFNVDPWTGFSPSRALGLSTPPPTNTNTKSDSIPKVCSASEVHGSNVLTTATIIQAKPEVSSEKRESFMTIKRPLLLTPSSSNQTTPVKETSSAPSSPGPDRGGKFGTVSQPSSPMPARDVAPPLAVSHELMKARILVYERDDNVPADDTQIKFSSPATSILDPPSSISPLALALDPVSIIPVENVPTSITRVESNSSEHVASDDQDLSGIGLRSEPDGNISDDGLQPSPWIDVSMRISTSSSTDDDSGSRSRVPSGSHVIAAEQVAAFMKAVKRIRFNSINIVKTDRRGLRCNQSRALSCPSLYVGETTSDSGNDESSYMMTRDDTGRVRRGSDVMHSSRTHSSSNGSGKGLVVSPVMMENSASMMTLRGSLLTTTVNTETQTSLYLMPYTGEDTSGGEAASGATTSSDDMGGLVPIEIESLLSMVLPAAPFIQCYSCMRQRASFTSAVATNCTTCTSAAKMSSALESSAKLGCSAKLKTHAMGFQSSLVKTGYVSPLFMSYSPSDLLDQYIVSGVRVHSQLLSKEVGGVNTLPTPPSGHVTTSASHAWVGGAGVDGVTNDHINLLHNQLLFERHRQELHARRNRRLLGRSVRVVSLEEQNIAMKDQLRLQEIEMNNLRECLQTAQQLTVQQKITNEKERSEAFHKLRNANEKIEELQVQVKELENLLTTNKSTTDDLVMKLDCARNELFSKDKDLEILKVKADNALQLGQVVDQLNVELLLMGELHEKYQQRLSSMTLGHKERLESQQFLQTSRAECIGLKKLADDRLNELEGERCKVIHAEILLKQKDVAIVELKKHLDNTKALHRDQVQMYEKQLSVEKQSLLGCQRQTLDLENQLAHAASQPPIRVHARVASRPSNTSSSPGSAEDVALAYDITHGRLSGEEEEQEEGASASRR